MRRPTAKRTAIVLCIAALPVLMLASYVATWLLLTRAFVNAAGPKEPTGGFRMMSIEGFGPIEDYIAADCPGADVLRHWQCIALKDEWTPPEDP